MAQPIPVTLEGYNLLKEELKRLKSVERPKVINEIARAVSMATSRTMPSILPPRRSRASSRAALPSWTTGFARAQIVDPTQMKAAKVAFSATVTLYNTETGEENTNQIVGEDEADLKVNTISINSPLARACIGKSLDDTVRVVLPTTVREYEITAIEYK